jgi:hypothetical protein
MNNLGTFSMRDLLEDLVAAESLPLPGFAKQNYAIACQVNRHTQSPPPAWIFLLIRALEVIIPELIKWLKDHYGTTWAGKLAALLSEGKTPWPGAPQTK